MSTQVIAVLGSLALYMLIIVGIGIYSSRFSRGTMEDFHMGSRDFRTIILFSAVFGANISAVTLAGVPGGAYHVGWVMWPYFASSWAWATPLLFYTVGSRSWVLGQKFGYMTVAEVVGGRWKSPTLAVVISLMLIFYTVPYLMTGLLGAGRTLEALTEGFVTLNVGMVIVASAVLVYLLLGGMRGAAWVNTFQTGIFLVGAVAIFVVIAAALGGPAEATRRVMEDYPELLSRSRMPWQQFFSYGVIVALSPIVFPQLFMRLLTGKDPKTLKQTMCIYPVPAFLMMFLMATVGMWGRTAIPGLEGAESDAILPMLLIQFTPIWMMGLLGAAAFAAMMSTMDSQLLSVTTMIARDFHGTYQPSSGPGLDPPCFGVGFPQSDRDYQDHRICLEWLCLHVGACPGRTLLEALHLVCLWSFEMGLLPASWRFGFLSGLPAIVVGVVVLVAVTYITPVPQDEGTREYFAIFDKTTP